VSAFGRIVRGSTSTQRLGRMTRTRAAAKDEPGDHALGRSRGGLSTKIHAAVDGRCRLLVILLTPGQGRRCSDDAATARRPAGRATARATAHPARPSRADGQSPTTTTPIAAATSSSGHSTASNTGAGSRPATTSTPPSTAVPSSRQRPALDQRLEWCRRQRARCRACVWRAPPGARAARRRTP
jgi:hypothetical protein